jgi:spermidine synthase
MMPWKLLDRAPMPDGGGELSLCRRGDEYSIRIDGAELMNSRLHASEEALARLTCERIDRHARVRVLIGGLGMGYTLAAALRALGPGAEVVVAELVPKVITWNRETLGELAGHPLRDGRVTLREIDVADILRQARDAYDAILLDVDNGPEGLSQRRNDWLYGAAGLCASRAALRRPGLLGVWSAGVDRAFPARMGAAGFTVEEIGVRARPGGGAHQVLWIGSCASVPGR